MISDNSEHPLAQRLEKYVESSKINTDWYEENKESILLIQDGIKIAGLEFDTIDLTAEPDNKDIWLHNGLCYFTFEKANECAKLQWKRLPTKEEWKKFIEFLPGNIENKVQFLMDVMGFPLSWFRCWDNSFFCNFWEDSWYWSSTWTVTHWYNLLFKKNYLNHGDFDFKGIGFLVRCLKK
jgi:hypothetical protein